MRDEDSNWFSNWDVGLPSPEDLIPLSQSLITPDLALAFQIPRPSAEFDSPSAAGSGGSDEPARTLKRPRLVWTPQLHKRFVDAVAHLGIKNAVPKTIMQLMSVDGLTRENVASHLQKYRLYLKRMQGISGSGSAAGSPSDAATDRLFASSPVPAHFLQPSRASSEHYLPYLPVAAPMQNHHAMAAAVPQFRQYGNLAMSGQFERPFVGQSEQRMVTMMQGGANGSLGGATNERKILTLFPSGED